MSASLSLSFSLALAKFSLLFRLDKLEGIQRLENIQASETWHLPRNIATLYFAIYDLHVQWILAPVFLLRLTAYFPDREEEEEEEEEEGGGGGGGFETGYVFLSCWLFDGSLF